MPSSARSFGIGRMSPSSHLAIQRVVHRLVHARIFGGSAPVTQRSQQGSDSMRGRSTSPSTTRKTTQPVLGRMTKFRMLGSRQNSSVGLKKMSEEGGNGDWLLPACARSSSRSTAQIAVGSRLLWTQSGFPGKRKSGEAASSAKGRCRHRNGLRLHG